MAALIRFPAETDDEFQRRTQPLIRELIESMKSWHRPTLEDNPLLKLISVNELRKSCGAEPVPSTFTWDVYSDVEP